MALDHVADRSEAGNARISPAIAPRPTAPVVGQMRAIRRRETTTADSRGNRIVPNEPRLSGSDLRESRLFLLPHSRGSSEQWHVRGECGCPAADPWSAPSNGGTASPFHVDHLCRASSLGGGACARSNRVRVGRVGLDEHVARPDPSPSPV